MLASNRAVYFAIGSQVLGRVADKFASTETVACTASAHNWQLALSKELMQALHEVRVRVRVGVGVGVGVRAGSGSGSDAGFRVQQSVR